MDGLGTSRQTSARYCRPTRIHKQGFRVFQDTTRPDTQPLIVDDRTQPITGLLVVDDDPAIRRFLEHGLTWAGYQVFSVSNLADAVKLYDTVRHQVRLALLDVSMPGGDGPAVLRELRRLSPELPAVFMSGQLDPGLTNPLADRLRREGAAGLVPKPIRLPDLFAVLMMAMVEKAPTAGTRPPNGLSPNGTGGTSHDARTPSDSRPDHSPEGG